MEEDSMGTVPFAIRFFKMTTIINVFFMFMCGVLSLMMGPIILGMPCMSLWPVIFCDMVIQCYQQPEMPRGLCCLPVQVKSKYYPIILFVLFSLFFGPKLSDMAGLAIGYFYVYGFMKWSDSNAQSLAAWEKSWPFVGFKNSRGFRLNPTALQNNPD